MAGVVSTQQPEMEDEVMRDASLLSADGVRLETGFASSPGDPMDISPRPATDQPIQQQPSESNSQSIVNTSDQMPNNPFPRLSSAGDYRVLSSASGYVKPEGKGSPGLQTRSTNYRPAAGLSPKDRTSLRQTQLKRLPLSMQAKLPTPTRPAAVGVNRPFRPSSLSSNPYKCLAMNGSSFANSFLRFNPPHSRPDLSLPTINRQWTSNTATGAFAGAGRAADEIAAKSATENTTAPTTATNQASEASCEKLPVQRMRFIEEESDYIDIRRPSSYVSPKYRKFTQHSLDSNPTSSAHLSQHPAPANDGTHPSSSQRQTAPTTSFNLISPFKPNFAMSKTRPISGANEAKHTEAWNDMKELDEVLREQGITPLIQEPPKQNPPHQDPFQKDPKTSPCLMPGSWPEDPLDFLESTKEGSHLPAQGPGLLRDHGWLMSGALDASPKLVPTTRQPIGTQDPPSSQNAEAFQTQGPEAVQEEQPQPSFSWCDQLHRIYNNSWGATQSVVTTAIALANCFKRRAVAIFEDRRPASRRPSTHTSSSPTRANLRILPEEQRRRLKSNQWRKDRGFPTVEEYPFPQLSFDAPRSPSTAAPVSKAEPSPKLDALPTPDTPEDKVSKESIIRNKRPGGRTVCTLVVKDSKRHSARSGVHKKSMARMRPSKRSLARTRLDRLSHAIDTGEVALDEIPTAKEGSVAAVHEHKRFVDPLANSKGSHTNFIP